MNPAFAKLLRNKRKRTRDPNLPPPPTLLGQVKELRITREDLNQVQLELSITRSRLDQLESKNRKLESHIRDLENFIRSRVR
jgi:hypothetical protein